MKSSKLKTVFAILIALVAILAVMHVNSQKEVPNEMAENVVEAETVDESYTFTDDLGRTVTVENPKRVASLLGSFTDMWFLAGGTVSASSDDAWEDFDLSMPADAVKLGQTKKLNLEKLLAVEPDFILASANTQQDMEWKDILEKTGIPTAYFEISDFEDYLRVLKICTDITGREDLYEENGLLVQDKIEEVIAKSEERVAKNGVPKVLFLRASAASIRAKNSKDNVLGEMLKSLGCDNIADNEESLLENVSVEHILKEDPDFIFFVQVGDDKEAAQENIENFIQDNPVWKELTAVKQGKVYHLDKTLYNTKPNDRWGEAYEELEKILADGQK